ncbi:MAG: hypothetical protein ACUVRX_08465 [Actinomycetota bacterium]
MLRRGMAFALENGYRAALRLDGEGQHPATYMTSLLWPVFNEGADMVMGSRFLEGGGYEGRITLPLRVGMAYFRFHLWLRVEHDFSHRTPVFRSYSGRAMSLLVERETLRYP